MRRVRGKIIAGMLGAAAVLASPAVFAQEQGVYIGGSYGQSTIKGGCDDLRSELAGLAVVTGCDDKDSGWKIFAGYRFNTHFALEATYIDFGAMTATARVGTTPISASGDATAFGVAAVGILPIGERFSLFGKAGVLVTDVSATASGGGISASESSSETELHYGLGATFNLSKRWAIRGEWERAEDSEVELMSIGVQYRF